MGRGGLRQLLSMSLPPCRRCYPAGGKCRLSQFATVSTVFDIKQLSRPPRLIGFEATPTFTHVTARWLAHHPLRWLCQWASGHSISLLPAIQATGSLASAPERLTPSEHASLSWSHYLIRCYKTSLKSLQSRTIFSQKRSLSKTKIKYFQNFYLP